MGSAVRSMCRQFKGFVHVLSTAIFQTKAVFRARVATHALRNVVPECIIFQTS